MANISKKKQVFPVSSHLREYLVRFRREVHLPVNYKDLLKYENAISLYDKKGNDTLWETVFYSQNDMQSIYDGLKKLYSVMKTDGAMEVIEHIRIDRVDLCIYGNSNPFRVRVVNQINDNFDYFYVKSIDASRVYGLELEHLLSPYRLSFLVSEGTLVEEHIAGIPGEQFINDYMQDPSINKTRIAKEFVKFNERCFVRLLGDMHANNFVINILPDFEEIDYRIRPIDFDQQSYEGNRSIYMPQYFKNNNPIIQLGLDSLTPETVMQYQREERSLMTKRMKIEGRRISQLLSSMRKEPLSPEKNIEMLREQLADFYEVRKFLTCKTMGHIVSMSLDMLFSQPMLYKSLD